MYTRGSQPYLLSDIYVVLYLKIGTYIVEVLQVLIFFIRVAAFEKGWDPLIYTISYIIFNKFSYLKKKFLNAL